MASALGPIYTRVGHTGAEELRFWGHRVFGELLGKTTATQLLLCGITGRLFDPEEILMVDDIVTAMTSADPRLWPFKITRLAAANGSATCGVASTLVASQGAIFGEARFRAIAEVLIQLMKKANSGGLTDDDLAALLREGIVGFGILYGRHDARFDALMKQATTRMRHERPYAQLCSRIVQISRSQLEVEPHVFTAIAALCLDLGMTSHQIGALGMLPLFHDALANAVEGARQQPLSLKRLHSDSVRYVGPAPRTSKRAGGERAPR